MFLHRFIFAFESLNSFPDSLLMIIFVVWITTSIPHQDYMTLMFFFNKKGLLYGFTFIFITKEITSSSILSSLLQTPDKILLDSPDLFLPTMPICITMMPSNQLCNASIVWTSITSFQICLYFTHSSVILRNMKYNYPW